MEILRKHIVSVQNIIHNAESHPTNYSQKLTSDWFTLGPLLLLLKQTVLQCYPSIQSNAELAHISADIGVG
jgi:hypothetical protein